MARKYPISVTAQEVRDLNKIFSLFYPDGVGGTYCKYDGGIDSVPEKVVQEFKEKFGPLQQNLEELEPLG
jgi:hypothetical protein